MKKGSRGPLFFLFGTLGLYLATLLPRLIWFNAEGGISVGHEHLWTDWPLHIAMLRRFSDCPPSAWLSDHPMIGGFPLRYPFVSALISGMLVRLGLSVPLAVTLPSLLYFCLLLLGMYKLWQRLLGGLSNAILRKKIRDLFSWNMASLQFSNPILIICASKEILIKIRIGSGRYGK